MGAPALTPVFFDHIGKKYEEAFGQDPGLIDFVKLALAMIPEKGSVLDIGCGTGKPVASMISTSGREVHGIDSSSTMISLSKKQVPDGSFEHISMFDYEPKASISFDAVCAFFSFFDMGGDLVGPLLRKIYDWVTPTGHLFIGVMVADDFERAPLEDTKDEYGGTHLPTRFMGSDTRMLVYSKKGWALMLREAGFRIVQSNTVSFQAPAEADCDLEPHHYIVARRVARE